MSWLKGMREKEPPEPTKPIGTVVIGTLQPDLIDAAKEMVRKSLKAAQFKTVDAGKGVSVAVFISKIKEANANIAVVTLSISAAKESLSNLISAMEAEGLKGKVAVMIGGAAATKEDAERIGAFYGRTKEDAVALAKKIVEQK